MKKNVLRFSAAAMALIMAMSMSVFAEGPAPFTDVTNNNGGTISVDSDAKVESINLKVTLPTKINFTVDQFNSNSDNHGDAMTSGNLLITNSSDVAAKVDITTSIKTLATEGSDDTVFLKKVLTGDSGVSTNKPGHSEKEAYLYLQAADTMDNDPTDIGYTATGDTKEVIYGTNNIKPSTKMTLTLNKPTPVIYGKNNYHKKKSSVTDATVATYISSGDYDAAKNAVNNNNATADQTAIVANYEETALTADEKVVEQPTYSAFKIAGVANPYATWADNDIKLTTVYKVSAVPTNPNTGGTYFTNVTGTSKVAKNSLQNAKLEGGNITFYLFNNDAEKNAKVTAANISDVKLDYEAITTADSASGKIASVAADGKITLSKSTLLDITKKGRNSVPVSLVYDGDTYSGDVTLGSAIANITSTTKVLTIPTADIKGSSAFAPEKLAAIKFKKSSETGYTDVNINTGKYTFKTDNSEIYVEYPSTVTIEENDIIDVIVTYDEKDFSGKSSAAAKVTGEFESATADTEGVTIKLFAKPSDIDSTKIQSAKVKVNAATFTWASEAAAGKFTVDATAGTLKVPTTLTKGSKPVVSVEYDGTVYTKKSTADDITVTDANTDPTASVSLEANGDLTVKITDVGSGDKKLKTLKQVKFIDIENDDFLCLADNGTSLNTDVITVGTNSVTVAERNVQFIKNNSKITITYVANDDTTKTLELTYTAS